MIPTDDLYESVFRVSEAEDEAVSDKFEEIGYESKISIVNLGSLFLFILIQPIQIVFYRLVKNACKNKEGKINKKLHKYADNKLKEICWNGLIDFYRSTYLCLTMIAFINMYDLSFATTV